MTSKRINPSLYIAGDAFHRTADLDFLLAEARGRTVLDIGCNLGHVSYEFARHGARLIHGFDAVTEGVTTCKSWFSAVPVESSFFNHNMLGETVLPDDLLPKYDIVLFLGVYHHLKQQAPARDYSELVQQVCQKTGRWLAVRTPLLSEVARMLLPQPFNRVMTSRSIERIGPIAIYERT